MLVVSRNASGQDSIAPKEVLDQSVDRMSAPIAPPSGIHKSVETLFIAFPWLGQNCLTWPPGGKQLTDPFNVEIILSNDSALILGINPSHKHALGVTVR
jgi:hypothetical protein